MCEELLGFGARKTAKTKKVVFFVRRSIRGKDSRVTLGTHPTMSVKEARRQARLQIIAIEQAAQGPESLQPAPMLQVPAQTVVVHDPRIDELLALLRPRVEEEKKPRLTFGELWEKVGPGWLASVKPSTAKNLRWVFESRVLPKWGKTPVDEIQPGNLTEWYKSFAETAPQYGVTATQKVIYLLKLGHEQGLVESLPVFKIRYAKAKVREPMSADAVCKLVDVLEDMLREDCFHSNPNAIIAILNTGERATAAAQLHTREVNYRQMCITKARKRDQVKKIPISSYMVSFLKSIHPKDGGYYFPNRNDPSQPIKYGALALFLKSLCGRHGIRTRDGSVPTIHCIRHTYATLLEEKGLPVSHIQRLLGHSSMETTLRYIHGSADAAREGAERLEITRVRVR